MIGREKEKEELLDIYHRDQAAFVAVYGRPRIGKTYLIDQTFEGKITFRHAGLSPIGHNKGGMTNAQLEHFYHSLLMYGFQIDHVPKDWLEAFFLLAKWIQDIDDGNRMVIFLDELPWMDTPGSGFITALEGFWNTWICHHSNVMLIVCGSTGSWILDKLINNHGGLYGRVTHEIRLAPFTLHECEQCLEENKVALSRYDVVQSYMIFGGIPYYLNQLRGEQSLDQNVDRLFFEKKASMNEEFDKLFASVFSNPDQMKAIVTFLNTKNSGYTRKEICEQMGVSSGGRITENLKALIASDFITAYIPFGSGSRNTHYKLTDPFCLFYLHFVKSGLKNDPHFWMNYQNLPEVNSWRGFAFENVCFNHIEQIKYALGISGVQVNQSPWVYRNEAGDDAQANLILERADHVVNACEIKFTSEAYAVNQQYYLKLQKRQNILTEMVKKKDVIRQTLITTYGLEHNNYWSIFTNVITMDDLFRE